VTPYAARPELLDDAPALITAIETEASESQSGIDTAALRLSAQQRIEAASGIENMEAGPAFYTFPSVYYIQAIAAKSVFFIFVGKPIFSLSVLINTNSKNIVKPKKESTDE